MKFGVHKQHLAFAARAATLAVAACLAACGGSSSNGASSGTTASSGTGTDAGTSAATSGATSTGPDDSGTTATVSNDGAAGACANPSVQIDFSPMYSAYISGENPPMHNFQVPAVTDDGNPAVWSSSDPTQVVMVAQTFGTNPALQGVMITLAGAGTGTTGQVTIYATEADGSCGASVLNITSNTEDEWQIGNARYNDGVTLTVGPGGGGGGMMFRPDGGFMLFQPDGGGGGGGVRTTDGGSFYERDGGTACTNCHGPTATNGPYRDVSHTPEQTGGFSDQELIGIFTGGMIPDGGYFDPSVITSDCDGGTDTITIPEEQQAIQVTAAAAAAHMRPVYPLGCTQAAYSTWHSFHQWTDIDTTEQPGVICYLRALQPAPQNGTSAAANFGGGGRGPRDGGAPRRRDGGFGLMPDAAQ
jgi:hypothetical protein